MKHSLKIKSLAKIKLLLFVFLFIATSASACDICGCFMGLVPYENQSSVGLLYRYRSFSGYRGQHHAVFPQGSNFFFPSDEKNAPLTGHQGNPSDYELYRTMEIRGRYFLHPRIEINAIIPYNSNSERYNGNTSSISGIGDINVYAGYHLINQVGKSSFSQRLIVGAGIKLPSGKNDLKTTSGIRYSALMQPGTGSTDGFLYANYRVAYQKFGLSINASYKVNGQNKEDEGIANSSTTFMNIFYNQRLSKDWQLLPSLQFFYEKSAGETYQGIKTGEHEMNTLMAGIGADLYYKNIALNVGLQRNVWQAETDHPQSSAKIYLGITYNINQLYHLIKS